MKNNIEQLTATYLQKLAKTAERRKYWSEKAKPFISQYLNEVAAKYPLPWKAGANEAIEGLESVFIALEAAPSGIAERTPFNLVHKLKAGAFLSFSQNRNGQVIVWMSFPFIEGLEEEAKRETFETVEPEVIDEALIVRNVEKLLIELAQWEDDGKDEIGFIRKYS